MAGLDLNAARLVRLEQALDALLPDDDPTLRQEIFRWLSIGAQQGLDLIPLFRERMRSLQSRPFGREASEEGSGRPKVGFGLEMEALPAAHRATLWPYRPKRLPDELLSSWLWRTARGLGAPPRRFAADAIGTRLPDIDREIDATAIARLAFLSGQSEESLWRGTIRADAPLASSDPRESVLQALLRHGDLVLNRARRGRSRPIIQYCPVCLGRGNAAYLRRGWRFSVEVVCFNDGYFLLDSCWRCGALLDPLSLAAPSGDFLCVMCGARLAAAPSLHEPETIMDQITVYAALGLCLFSTGPDRITTVGEEYIEELSSGALRGTNPANTAERHYAIMVEAARIRAVAMSAKARTRGRQRGAARVREAGAKPPPGQPDPVALPGERRA